MFPAPPNFSAAVHPLQGFNFGHPQPFGNTGVGPQGPYIQQDPLHQGADPSSPDLFKNNISLVYQRVLQLQTHARQVLAAIQNAYQTGYSPAHTEASLAALKQLISEVTEAMRQSGVGALPVLPGASSGTATVPTEEQLLISTTRNLRTIYEKLQRSQDSAATAANLLSMDYGPIRGAPQTLQSTMQK